MKSTRYRSEWSWGMFITFVGLVFQPQPGYSGPPQFKPTRPKLVVMVVIDQFRADYLTRFESRFLPAFKKNGEVGGFQYLKTQSAYFPQGQYDILQSVTAPGHATVLTGAYPYQAGIPINDWYDANLGKNVYCTEDPLSPLVGSSGPILNTPGMSPSHLKATTVGDELKNAGFPSRVVSIALKDRAAILMGGHRSDISLWYHAPHHEWVSSRFYFPSNQLPEWVLKLNQRIKKRITDTFTWMLTGPGTGFSSAESGQKFPYSFPYGSEESLSSPLGTEMTVEAVKAALDAYPLGQGPSTDLLAVSFSSHDKVGHASGPNSLKMEEMTVDEDRRISQLLNLIRKKVPGGLKNVLLVFTADHGVAPSPTYAVANRLDSGRIDNQELVTTLLPRLNEKFGKPSAGDWILSAREFNFYLNHAAIAEKKLDKSVIEAAVKTILLEHPHVAHVFTATEYDQRKLPPGMFERQILHTFFRGRSGDVILIPRPLYFSGSSESKPGSTSHNTGYSYDRTVPILLSGSGIKPGSYGTAAAVVDLAPTISYFTGTIPPSLSEGRILSEILK